MPFSDTWLEGRVYDKDNPDRAIRNLVVRFKSPKEERALNPDHGNFKVQVAPGSTQVCTIEHRWNPTVLTANGNEDEQNWGPKYIWGKFDKYTWNIE